MPTRYKIATLDRAHLATLLDNYGAMATSLEQAYLSPGSVGYCLLENNVPVFAGGIVNMQWRRGEAWMIPTKFYRTHKAICLRYLCRILPVAVVAGGFRRVQATCEIIVSTTLFNWLGFKYEGTLAAFGPNGETCHMYSKVFTK